MTIASLPTAGRRYGLALAFAAAALLAACTIDNQDKAGSSAGSGSTAATAKAAPGVVAPGAQLNMRAVPAGSAQSLSVTYPPQSERYPSFAENTWQQVTEAPLSTIAMEVDTAAYSRLRRMISDGFLPPRDALRIEEMVNYFEYAYADPADPAKPFAISANVLPSPWNSETRLLHVGIKAWEPLRAAERPAANLVLLVDISGSMKANDRLPLVKRALKLLVGQLRPQDHAALVVYAGTAQVVLEPLPGSGRNRLQSEIERLSAGGSTAGGAGLALAYRLAEQHFDPAGVNRILLFSDGDFNVGPSDSGAIGELIATKRTSGVYLSVFTVGTGNLNDRIAQSLAQQGNGIAAYLDGLGEARRLFEDQLAATLTPIADDVKAQIEFNPQQVAEYRLIGYETRRLAYRDFTDDRVDAGEVGSGHSVTLLYEFRPLGAAPPPRSLRYQSAAAKAKPPSRPANIDNDVAREFAHLTIRYKLPGQQRAREISRPITFADAHANLEATPREARFAAAVAAFGLALRGTPDLGGFSLDQVARLADGARGPDPRGERAEFLRLVRDAESLQKTSGN
ncbi:MAG: von Willebrand factor type A domain-containing protein [Alphaproteobacteria bacterium]|nr:von Willebrand factor type A domain-containing protein [Alphaproteobacteria bacterium]